MLEERGDGVALASEELLAARDELARLTAEYDNSAARAAELRYERVAPKTNPCERVAAACH